MNKKERERFYFDRLRIALPSIPPIEPTSPDPPDFLISAPESRLGIELTEFHLPPPPGRRPRQEIRSLQEQIVSMAEKIHRQECGPALYVRVYFSHHAKLFKAGVRPMALALARTVLSLRPPSSLYEPDLTFIPDEVLPAVAEIVIRGSIDGIDKLWSASGSAWVVPVLPAHITEVIVKKSTKVRRFRRLCDTLWLVIVQDDFRGTMSELSDEARHYTYPAPFDKVLWLNPHRPSAVELNLLREDSL